MNRTICILLMLACAGGLKSQTEGLMPMPSSTAWNGERFRIERDFAISVTGNPDPRIYAEASRFFRRLGERTGLFFKTWVVSPKDARPDAPLKIKVKAPGRPELGMDESYRLAVNGRGILLEADTDIGALRGLETLLQLIGTDASGSFFHGGRIEDKPRFAWRGLLISQPYHFMPVDVLKRTLDAMALVKMNVLHLYLSDDQGFSIESKAYPRLHREAAGGDYLTQDQVRDLIAYAAQRGIRIVPELDLPGHCTSILTVYPELAAVKRDYVLQDHWGVFDPVMDPTKERVYTFLDTLLTELATLFPDEYFHIGGDEVTGEDWKRTDSVQRFMKQMGLGSTVALQNHFNRKVQAILRKSGKKIIGWDEILMSEIDDKTARDAFHKGDYKTLVLTDVPKDIVIQSWRGMEALISAAKNGYRGILSKGYYIDLMQSTAYHYLNDPVPSRNETIIPDSEANFNRFESEIVDMIRKGEKILNSEEESLILGGEATMWTEHVTYETFDSRVWPRTAAIAERLWSPVGVRDVADMYRRLDNVSLQLEWVGSTHIKNAGMMMRRLAGTEDVSSLMKVVGYVEPLKGYRRNAANNFTKYSPYTQLIDVASADPREMRSFNASVDSFLAKPTPERRNRLAGELRGWMENHRKVEAIAAGKPTLSTLRVHSGRMSELAAMALPYVEGKGASQKANAAEAKRKLKEAEAPAGYCELGVVPALRRLMGL